MEQEDGSCIQDGRRALSCVRYIRNTKIHVVSLKEANVIFVQF